MNELTKYSTVELYEELLRRPGVSEIVVSPHEDETVVVNGPARILINED